MRSTLTSWKLLALRAFFGMSIIFAINLICFAQATSFSVGDKVEVLSTGTWYKADVLEAKGGQYKIHYDGWGSTWDEWVNSDRIRRSAQPSTDAKAKWGAMDAWRADYSVGDKVKFSISGKAADFQSCTVAENIPDAVMRVKCDAFKDWVAGVYIVFSEGNIRKTAPPADDGDDKPAVKPTKKTGGNSSGLKIGEYACTGSGGRMMIGLGFKVVSATRYTDLDGKRGGTFSISGGKVTFRGGHMTTITGRDLKDNWFTVGAQASCGPF